jgi:hypothetical protein
LRGEGSWVEDPILGEIRPPVEKIVFCNRLHLYLTPPDSVERIYKSRTYKKRVEPALRAGGKAYPCAALALSGLALVRPNGTGAR